jgi:hypothetical protein
MLPFLHNLYRCQQLHGGRALLGDLIVVQLIKNYLQFMGPRIYYRNDKNPPTGPISSQMDQVHNILPYFLKAIFKINSTLLSGGAS